MLFSTLSNAVEVVLLVLPVRGGCFAGSVKPCTRTTTNARFRRFRRALDAVFLVLNSRGDNVFAVLTGRRDCFAGSQRPWRLLGGEENSEIPGSSARAVCPSGGGF